MKYWFFGLLLCGVFSGLTGCSNSAGGPSTAGEALLLETEPADALDVVELKTNLIAGLAAGEVSIVGRVGSGQEETWDPDQASFMIRDVNLTVESHDHGAGGHDNCKFCQEANARALESMALVQVVDESGSVIQTNAQGLLGLKENHIIVATGEGEIQDGTLVFNAKKVYIRR